MNKVCRSLFQKSVVLGILLLPTELAASVLSFHSLLSAGASGSDFDYQGATVTATASRIYGDGYAAALADTGNSTSALPNGLGLNPANGAYTDNGLFEDVGDISLRSNSTRLEGRSRYVGNGDGANMANFVGFHVHFSQAVPMFDLFMMDLDGGEYGFSFALNSTVSITPNITLGDPSEIAISTGHTFDTAAMNTAISTLTTGVAAGAAIPPTIDVAYDSPASGNWNATDPRGQLKFSYDGQLITDLFYLWGKWGDTSSEPETNSQRSGISGFSVVPEPQSAVLILFSALGLIFLRRRPFS